MPSGIKEIFKRFRKVMTVEGTWADRPDEDELIDEENRRYAPLAMMLRARTLVDVDCWTEATRPADQAGHGGRRPSAPSWLNETSEGN